MTVNAGTPQCLLSRQYRQWCCRDAVFAWTRTMKIRCFCIVLIVSGALLTEVNNNLSLSGNNLLVVNNLRAAGKPECRPLGAASFRLSDSV